MEQDNKYKEYSTEKVNIYKESWDKDFFDSIRIKDSLEAVFIVAGLFTFLYLSWGLKVILIVALVLFYWFRIKWVERKIVKAKQFLVLGDKFLNENFRGRGLTGDGTRPQYESHRNGFEDYMNFLEIERSHLVARMVILNLFALVLLEIIKPSWF